MEEVTRIGFVGIIIEDRDAVAPVVNKILSQYANIIRARLGMPYPDRGVNVVTLVVDATADQVGALSGALGQIEGVRVKCALSKEGACSL